MRLIVTISKTARGDQDDIQIISDDTVSVNVVLVADAVSVQDSRDPMTRPAPRGRRGARR